jgi:hypothetical protein
MPKQVQYFFARLNLLPIKPYLEKLEWLRETLQSLVHIEYGDVVWQIFRVEQYESELGVFFGGYLGRYKEETKVEVASPRGQEIGIETIENLVTAKTLFFLHVKSGIIAYHSIPKQIPPGTFRTRFEQLLFKAAGGFFVDVEIDSVDEEASLRDQIKNFDLIKQIRIVLHPSNPSNRERWKRIDARMKELRATEYSEDIKSTDSLGLKIATDDDVERKISMAEDGYGKATVRGEIRGESHTVTTTSHPVLAEAPAAPEIPRNILRHLEPPFSRILKRFKE